MRRLHSRPFLSVCASWESLVTKPSVDAADKSQCFLSGQQGFLQQSRSIIEVPKNLTSSTLFTVDKALLNKWQIPKQLPTFHLSSFLTLCIFHLLATLLLFRLNEINPIKWEWLLRKVVDWSWMHEKDTRESTYMCWKEAFSSQVKVVRWCNLCQCADRRTRWLCQRTFRCTRKGRDRREPNPVAHEIENCFKSGWEEAVNFQKFHIPRFGDYFPTMALLTCSTRILLLFKHSFRDISKNNPKLETACPINVNLGKCLKGHQGSYNFPSKCTFPL